MKTQVLDINGKVSEESRLAQMVEKDKDNVIGWITGREISKDPLMKNYYLTQMVKCIRRNENFNSYAQGIFYTSDIGKKHLQQELMEEMLKKYPIRGLSIKLLMMLR